MWQIDYEGRLPTRYWSRDFLAYQPRFPVVADRVLVLHDIGLTIGIDVATGEEIWRRSSDAQSWVVGADEGRVLILESSNTDRAQSIAVLRAEDGAVEETTPVGPNATPLMQNGYLVILEGAIVSVDPTPATE